MSLIIFLGHLLHTILLNLLIKDYPLSLGLKYSVLTYNRVQLPDFIIHWCTYIQLGPKRSHLGNWQRFIHITQPLACKLFLHCLFYHSDSSLCYEHFFPGSPISPSQIILTRLHPLSIALTILHNQFFPKVQLFFPLLIQFFLY